MHSVSVRLYLEAVQEIGKNNVHSNGSSTFSSNNIIIVNRLISSTFVLSCFLFSTTSVPGDLQNQFFSNRNSWLERHAGNSRSQYSHIFLLFLVTFPLGFLPVLLHLQRSQDVLHEHQQREASDGECYPVDVRVVPECNIDRSSDGGKWWSCAERSRW